MPGGAADAFVLRGLRCWVLDELTDTHARSLHTTFGVAQKVPKQRVLTFACPTTNTCALASVRARPVPGQGT
eukprot:12255042-Alexandrium_andersonii.AAC.1